jgi:Mn2+/Fe2+ NRAMP family transporter
MATLIPQFTFSSDYLMNLVAVLGTTISPYLFFWQASEEAEESVSNGKLKAIGYGKPKITAKDVLHMRRDTGVGMFFSNAIMFFIIATAAATLHTQGISTIESAHQAAEVLRPVAGEFAFLIFTLGIVGTGLLAVPILAGAAAYAAAESFRWKASLAKTFPQAPQFYLCIAAATIIGAFINLLPIPPFRLLYYTAVLNGLIAPPLLFVILKIGNDRTILGRRTNPWWSNLGGVIVLIVMTIASEALIWQMISGWMK